jgi:hypothetical protein
VEDSFDSFKLTFRRENVFSKSVDFVFFKVTFVPGIRLPIEDAGSMTFASPMKIKVKKFNLKLKWYSMM